VDNNHTIKKIGDRYRVFINLGNGMTFPLPGEHDTEADAQAAYARWQADDDKRRNWHEFDQFTGAPG